MDNAIDPITGVVNSLSIFHIGFIDFHAQVAHLFGLGIAGEDQPAYRIAALHQLIGQIGAHPATNAGN